MPNTVSIRLERTDRFQLRGTTPQGSIVLLDAPVSMGGKDEGVRPMEMLLMSLAGCASMDVLLILEKQRQEVKNYRVDAEGIRADAMPAVYQNIILHFQVSGELKLEKLQEAIRLSAEKYCSVSAMLSQGGVHIDWKATLIEEI